MFCYRDIVCALAWVFGLIPAAAAEDRTWRPDAPVAVVKSKDYLIHFLPPAGLGSDAAFLHTMLWSGEMKVLLPIPKDRFAVLGYIADRERLYVAMRSQFTYYAPGSGLPYAPEVRFHTYAFWLADGDELVHKELNESDVPEKLRTGKPAAPGGPIELLDGGARCFGQTLKFDGKIIELSPRPK